MNDSVDLNIEALPYTPISVSTICPAVMLAANRNDSVIGRTIFLVVSMRTKNGFNQSGAPLGRSLAKKVYGAYSRDEVISINHNGRAKERVKIRCLDRLNMYGISPARLISKIIRNKVLSAGEKPFMFVPSVRDTWSCINVVGLFVRTDSRE